VGEDHAVQDAVVALVRERPPEGLRSAAVQETPAVREERVVQMVEVVGHGFAEHGAEGAEEHEENRPERNP